MHYFIQFRKFLVLNFGQEILENIPLCVGPPFRPECDLALVRRYPITSEKEFIFVRRDSIPSEKGHYPSYSGPHSVR